MLGNFSGFIAVMVVFAALGGLIGIGFLVWYLWAMSRLFPRIGLPAGHGWIPIWNDWRLMERTGLPGWIAILYVVPIGNVVAVVFRTIAQHRIGREAGVGAGYTVLGLFIAPLWATLLGSHLRGRVLPDPSTPGVYGAVSTQPPPYARGQAVAAPAAGFGAAAAQGFGAHAPAPPAPAHAADAPFAPMPLAPAAPPAAASLSPAAPDPWASPAWASAPVPESSGVARPPAGSAPASDAGPLGRETEAEYARLAAESFQTPPAAPLGPPPPPEPFSWTAASQPQPEQEPAREVPTPPVHPLAAPQAQAAPPAPPMPPAPPTVSAPAPAPAPAPVPVILPPAPQEGVDVDPDSSGTGLQEQAAPPVAAVHRSTGITASHRPTADAGAAAEEDELDRTVVVPRGPRVGWVIEMPDGEMLAIEHDTILGRRPEAIDGARTVAIPDPTRTLSKTHARLRYDGENWTVEDLESTNGVFLVHADGREEELAPRTPTEVDSRLMLGTLHIRLRRSDETV